jgi:hypothetical protein
VAENNIIMSIFKSTFTKNYIKMVDLEQYDIALAKHHDTVIQLRLPFVLGFHHSYLDDKTLLIVLSVIAKASRWRAEDWISKNKLKDEVVIVTDAKLEIVFASHNMTKMNGYVEEK